MSQEETVKKMQERLLASARVHADEIVKFHKNNYEIALKNYEEVLKNEVNLYMEKELAELKEENSLLNAKANMKLRNLLFSYRKEKVDQLFEKVRQDLVQFVSSDQYPVYLKSKWEEMQQLVDCNQGTVYIRECDADLIAQFVGCCQIQTTSDITIGGFVFMSEDGRKEYNVTLDQALIDQVSWFEEKSQLVL